MLGWSPKLVALSGCRYQRRSPEMAQLLARDRTRFGQRADRVRAVINSMLGSQRMAVAG